MGLFDWLAGLFGGKSGDTPEEVAERIDRLADRFRHGGDDAAAEAAQAAAAEVRRVPGLAEAQQIEAKFLASRGLRPDGRPMKPAFGRSPTDAEYVRYGSVVRSGGSRSWRYNNPGYVRCSSRSAYYGALGCDGEFAIFPDHATGLSAMHQSLRDDYPDQTLRDALRQHLPPDVGADPDRICDEAGLDPSAKIQELSDRDCRAIGSALESHSGWTQGEQFDRGAADSPAWIESAWDSAGAAESEDSALTDDGDSTGAAPTDDS